MSRASESRGFDWMASIAGDPGLAASFRAQTRRTFREAARLLGLRLGSWSTCDFETPEGSGGVRFVWPEAVVEVLQLREGADRCVRVVACVEEEPVAGPVFGSVLLMADPNRLADVLAATVPGLVRPSSPPEEEFWETKENWQRRGSVVHSLVLTGWRAGEPVLQNRATIRISDGSGGSTPATACVGDAVVRLLEGRRGDGPSIGDVLEASGLGEHVSRWTSTGATIYGLEDAGRDRTGVLRERNLLEIRVEGGRECSKEDLSRYVLCVLDEIAVSSVPSPGP